MEMMAPPRCPQSHNGDNNHPEFPKHQRICEKSIYVKELCDTFPNSIRAFQEHWMKSPLKRHLGVNKLRQVHDDFDGWGTSAMRGDMENHVRVGRLFGGTGYI